MYFIDERDESTFEVRLVATEERVATLGSRSEAEAFVRRSTASRRCHECREEVLDHMEHREALKQVLLEACADGELPERYVDAVLRHFSIYGELALDQYHDAILEYHRIIEEK